MNYNVSDGVVYAQFDATNLFGATADTTVALSELDSPYAQAFIPQNSVVRSIVVYLENLNGVPTLLDSGAQVAVGDNVDPERFIAFADGCTTDTLNDEQATMKPFPFVQNSSLANTPLTITFKDINITTGKLFVKLNLYVFFW